MLCNDGRSAQKRSGDSTYEARVESDKSNRDDAESKHPAGPAELAPVERHLRMVTRAMRASEFTSKRQPPAVAAFCTALRELTARPLMILKSEIETVEFSIANARPAKDRCKMSEGKTAEVRKEASGKEMQVAPKPDRTQILTVENGE